MYAALITSPFLRERVRVRVFLAVKGHPANLLTSILSSLQKERRSISQTIPRR
jgi:hypothetical protein